MTFLILKEKNSIQALFLAIFIVIATYLFILIPTKAFANNLFVVTQLPTQLDKRMSVLSGFVSNDSGDSASVWFEYGKNGRFEESSSKHKITGTRDFTSRVYGLEPEVLYSYRAVARRKNSNVIKYGDTKTFIIDGEGGGSSDSSNNSSTQQTNNYSNQTSGQCVVCCQCGQTNGVSVIPVASSSGTVETTNTTATLYGVVLTGGVPTRGWFEWGTTRSLGRVTPAEKLGSASRVEMKETIYGLSPGTTYYYRTVAVSAGVSRSAIINFKTKGVAVIGLNGESKDEAASTQESSFGNETKNEDEKSLIKETSEQDKESLDKDSEKSIFAWGSTLRGQFFTIDEKGNIDTGISFNETKKEKQNFLLASAAYGKRFLPDTWSEWGFITIFLYLIISRFHNFLEARKKKKEEKKERKKELQQARNTQLEQTTNGGGVIA